MIIKKKEIKIIEEPDLVLESDDVYKDILKIYKREKEICIGCEVDGTGNFWSIPLEEIERLIK